MIPSHNSPKNTYRVEFSFNYADDARKSEATWTVHSWGAMTEAECDRWAAAMAATFRENVPQRRCCAKVMKNNATWPHFDWQIVKEVEI